MILVNLPELVLISSGIKIGNPNSQKPWPDLEEFGSKIELVG